MADNSILIRLDGLKLKYEEIGQKLTDPEVIADVKQFVGLTKEYKELEPITALGAVGAALSLIPEFLASGWIDGNAIAVFTAIGMCWSGYLSTHTAMLDSLGYRQLTSKAILSHTIGGLVAAITAHWVYVLYALIF